jgi:serine/threonine protein kinase
MSTPTDSTSDQPLGSGTYGQVTRREGNAVKTVTKLRHLVHEALVLRYCCNCEYLVKLKQVNPVEHELVLELHETNLRSYYASHRVVSWLDRMRLFHDILQGLVEIHDRNLVHGDIKPTNILLRTNPLRAVIADCGFMSLEGFAKTHLTAVAYRDPRMAKSWHHDIYSLGIMLIELFGNHRLGSGHSYSEIRKLAIKHLDKPHERDLVLSMVQPRLERRPTARAILLSVFDLLPTLPPVLPAIDVKTRKRRSSKALSNLETTMTGWCAEFRLARAPSAVRALRHYLLKFDIPIDDYPVHGCITLYIMSCHFGSDNYTQHHMKCLYTSTTAQRMTVLQKLLDCSDFVTLLFDGK